MPPETKMTIDFDGMRKLLDAMDDDVLRTPIRKLLQKSAFEVEKEAKKRAPVDTGLLRSSITTSIDFRPVPTFASVGTNVHYAPYMEFGTGLLAEGEPAKGGRHYPPASALDRWATRHGFPEEGGGFLVARAIGRRGGLEPRRYLTGGAKVASKRFPKFINTAAEDIAREFIRMNR